MRVRPLNPFGAEIADLRIDAADWSPDAMRETIARHRMVAFRDQATDDATLVAFLAALGELTFTQGEVAVPGAPDLNIVSNMGRATPPRSVFHTDTSYVARPPAFTALRAVTVPTRGGATLFTDQVRAASTLPPRIRHWLAGRSVAHRATGLDGRAEETRQPLFRRHPLTGEVALYLSTPARCHALSGMDERTSARVIAALYRHSIRPSRLHRHHWRAGDVVVWDNRVTMHRADHEGVVGDRVLHRGLTLGEAPLAA